jgi:hypothetical protein
MMITTQYGTEGMMTRASRKQTVTITPPQSSWEEFLSPWEELQSPTGDRRPAMRTIDELPLPQRSAYLAGYNAFQNGDLIENNPSDPKSYLGILWDLGWADADEDVRTD